MANPANAAAENSGKLSWLTRIAYGLGDTAQNIVWGAMSILTFFYTDYAGIDPAMVGLVFLISRCFDGFSDVIMGFIVERTNSKWGKSRPWILWMSVPFALSIVLIYTVPQGSSALQFAYLFVTYNFCTTVCYTALNLPYGSLSAMMTRISKERDMLSITRMTLSPQPDGLGRGHEYLGSTRSHPPALLLLAVQRDRCHRSTQKSCEDPGWQIPEVPRTQ